MTGFLKNFTGRRCHTLIPHGLPRGDNENASLRRAYISCDDFRGLDDPGLLDLLRTTVHGLYEDVFYEAGEDPLAIPDDLIGPISLALAEANDKKQNFVLLPKLILLYLLEFTRVYKVGSQLGLHAGMEWPSMQIP